MTGICEPRSTFPDTLDGVDATGTNNERFYQNSLFIQGIPLHIKRQEILNLVQNESGFIKMILSDPIRNPRRVRYGWVYFNNREVCEKLVRHYGEGTGGINGMQINPQFSIRVLPKQKSRRTPKYAPPESMYPYRVAHDIQLAYKLCCKFDKESLIYHNPLLNPKFLNSLDMMRRLNVLILYLRHIHFLCYYCGKHFLSEEHMFARCSAFHERKYSADMMYHKLKSKDDPGSLWERDVDKRIVEILKYQEYPLVRRDDKKDGDKTKSGSGTDGNTNKNGNGSGNDSTEMKDENVEKIEEACNWVERKQREFLSKNSKKVDAGKHRCIICTKLFRAPIYVHKHIKNKHETNIAKYIADERLKTTLDNYRRDRDRLTIHSFEDKGDSGGYDRDFGYRGARQDNRHHRHGGQS